MERATHCIADSSHLFKYYLDSIRSDEDVSICEEKHFPTHRWVAPHNSNFVRECEKPVIYNDRYHRTMLTPWRLTSDTEWLTENGEIDVVTYYAKDMGQIMSYRARVAETHKDCTYWVNSAAFSLEDIVWSWRSSMWVCLSYLNRAPQFIICPKEQTMPHIVVACNAVLCMLAAIKGWGILI